MPTLSSEIETRIKELITSGNKIAAIALYRETTGVSLKEAKEAVEAMAHGKPVNHQNLAPPDSAWLETQVRQLLADKKKIEAIKIYRESHHCGLKDAKDAVDRIELQMRQESGDDPFAQDTQRMRSCLIAGIGLVLALLGGALFYLVTKGIF